MPPFSDHRSNLPLAMSVLLTSHNGLTFCPHKISFFYLKILDNKRGGGDKFVLTFFLATKIFKIIWSCTGI
jgi:hypothetical protein